MATEQAEQEPLDRIDQIMDDLSANHATIVKILAASMAEHRAVSAKYAPQLNPLYRQCHDLFEELTKLAEANKHQLMARGKKSSRRPAGVIGWRENTRLILEVTEEQLVARIRELDLKTRLRFLQREVSYKLRTANLKNPKNGGLVDSVEGVKVSRQDMLYIKPHHGLPMSAAAPWWPTLEGVNGSAALLAITHDPNSES